MRSGPVESTGFPALDHALPGGGWPAGSLVELLCETHGIGEIRLLLPLVQRAMDDGRRVLLVHPPYVPYAPAWCEHQVDLSRMLWLAGDDEGAALAVAERAARSATCAVVLLWLRHAGDGARAMRRLQLAAQAGCCLVFAMRDVQALVEPSPAALRASLRTVDGALWLDVHKCRGRAPGALRLTLD